MKARFTTNCFKDRDRLAPSDVGFAIGVLDESGALVGMAFGAGFIGGGRTDWSRPGYPAEFTGPIEAVWRLTVGKAEVEGRFVLRRGEFVELAEDAE